MRLAFAATLILLALVAPTAQAAVRETRIIVRRDPGLSAAERSAIRADAGVTLAEKLPLSNTEVVTADADRARAALRRLNADADVRYAELDRPVRAFAADPLLGQLWALKNTGQAVFNADPTGPANVQGTGDADMDVLADGTVLADAWSTSRGLGHTVAVVDTGVDAAHPDLTGQTEAGLDWVDGDAVADDAQGHGTHVAGTIGALEGNGVGVAGVAPGSRLLPLRVLDANGSGYTSDVVAAFALAGQLGVHVVNASLGAALPSQAERDAIAAASNTLFVVAAGNDGTSYGAYPCAYNLANILCVGASDQTDHVAPFSNRSATDVDVFAPGDNIVSTWLGGQYVSASGTSMAAPQVAGLVALLLGKNPQLTTDVLKSTVMNTVNASGNFTGMAVTGGRVNVTDALAAVPAFTCSVACAPTDDRDQDGVANASDTCPDEPGTAPNGCIAVTSGVGDSDGDGKIDRFDACPTVPGTGPDGCPLPAAPPPTQSATPSPPRGSSGAPDRDGDGRSDALDACPAEAASSADGCPVPALRSLSVGVAKRSRKATTKISLDRAATVAMRIDQRVCKRKRGRSSCRWSVAARAAKGAPSGRATFSNRLRRGSYRVTVTLSSSAGAARPVRKSFRVR